MQLNNAEQLWFPVQNSTINLLFFFFSFFSTEGLYLTHDLVRKLRWLKIQ